MSRPSWRYRSACCNSSAWRYRPTLGVYYCPLCGEHSERLVDAKTGAPLSDGEVPV